MPRQILLLQYEMYITNKEYQYLICSFGNAYKNN